MVHISWLQLESVYPLRKLKTSSPINANVMELKSTKSSISSPIKAGPIDIVAKMSIAGMDQSLQLIRRW